MNDISGQRFGRLIAVKPSHKDKRLKWYWLCKCDCGKESIVAGDKLRRGVTKSCGCLQRETREKSPNKSHGMTKSRLYYEWCNMRSRCNNPKNNMFKRYGGRGISVCSEWDKFETFIGWALTHGYNDSLTLERNNIDDWYCPSNCRWIPAKEQYLNRSDSHFITAFGETKTIKEWSDETGIKYDTIERRINAYGWPVEEALTTRPWGKRHTVK